jgi:multiple sugar transport system ATP-binding protein
MTKLELENIKKQYSPKIIPVKDVSLTVESNEFLTLLGPSGCGKSTLLRLIAGLEPPTEGRVIINNQTVNHKAPVDRHVAMVFQSYALYPHLTAAENIRTPLKLKKKLNNLEIEQKVNLIADKLEIKPILPKKPADLSGGQRQRVALARALVRDDVDVFLLDEPLSNLDALLREKVRAELKQIFQESEKPVIYVTHDQTEALTLSTKVAVLQDGFIQQLAPPSEIYSQPANIFVAGFVGSPQMNLLILPYQNNKAMLGRFSIPLAPETSSHLNTDYIVMGVRPEDVHIPQGTSEEQVIAGKVFLVEELGKFNLVSMYVQDSQLILQEFDQDTNTENLVVKKDKPVTLRAMIPADHTWEGEMLQVALPLSFTHWFDLQTGDRL